jgi:hypothetical protein
MTNINYNRTFYSKYSVIPTIKNNQFDVVSHAIICCWIICKNVVDAKNKLEYIIETSEWIINECLLEPIEVHRNDFIDKDLGLEAFDNVQKYGHVTIVSGVARDGMTNEGPIEIKQKREIDIAKITEFRKKVNSKGRCFHYDAGVHCSEYIMAHSIQRNNLLSNIARDGHVYGLDTNFASIAKNCGKVSYKLKGINELSTFKGFCGKHDNELFRPIDDFPVIPTDEQTMLYAYRSIARELFVKQNALIIMLDQIDSIQNETRRNIAKSHVIGLFSGYESLNVEKNYYDISLKNKRYEDIEYIVFLIENKPSILFSSLMFPDFDYQGNQLQDLANLDDNLSLITYCSGWLSDGWAFVFSWHKNSSIICRQYIKSLFENQNGSTFLTDCLFRLAVGCENNAISPEWWDNESVLNKQKIIDRVSDQVDMLADSDNDHYRYGLEDISKWKIRDIVSNIEYLKQ